MKISEMRGQPLINGIICLIVPALSLWLGAVTVCPAGSCRIPEADGQILAVMNSLRTPWWDLLFGSITWLGSMAVLLPMTVGLVWHFIARRRYADALLFYLSLSGAWLIAFAAKYFIQRPRPELFPFLTTAPTDFSFPSAHGTQITAFGLAWLLFGPNRPGWGRGLLVLFLIVAVACSRLYLQVHFPSDVLAGVLAAAAWVICLRLLLADWIRDFVP